MDKSPKHEATTQEIAAEQPREQASVNSDWSTIQSQVARAVPRLREIATTAALLGPVLLQPIMWGGGRGGC
ncbi:MAG: hypothetical protein HGA45_33325 [Chloroflexales bacterium]|nr:hypothetical protein [Chloroflexales bacterium]